MGSNFAFLKPKWSLLEKRPFLRIGLLVIFRVFNISSPSREHLFNGFSFGGVKNSS